MEQCCGLLAREIFRESTAISETILPRERERSLAHAQMCSFLINEQCCGPLAVEIIPGKNCDYSINHAKSARAQSKHVQRCSFLIMEQSCGPLAVEMIPGKHCDFSTYLAKNARAQSGACADVQFHDYGSVLWSTGSRNRSVEALGFQHISCQESESSVWSMRRGAVS
jgi:hypothetical protein